MVALDVRCLYTGRFAWMVMGCECLLFTYHLWSCCDTFFDLLLFELPPKGGRQMEECLCLCLSVDALGGCARTPEASLTMDVIDVPGS